MNCHAEVPNKGRTKSQNEFHFLNIFDPCCASKIEIVGESKTQLKRKRGFAAMNHTLQVN